MAVWIIRGHGGSLCRSILNRPTILGVRHAGKSERILIVLFARAASNFGAIQATHSYATIDV